MNMLKTIALFSVAMLSASPLGACASSAPSLEDGEVLEANDELVGTAQLPPTGNAAAISTWLKSGVYKAWKCEAAAHTGRGISPHGMNRICSNTALRTSVAGNYPVGAAGVKEIYTGSKISGYAFYRKLKAGAGADKWYWYEDLNNAVQANGPGTSGIPKTVCADCHSSAPRDFVFTQVR
jgi:hypothetical protein